MAGLESLAARSCSHQRNTSAAATQSFKVKKKKHR
jgi:hypothetical protein